MTRIEGAVAVVTGAGSGIGRALALQLARRGCRLALSDVRGDRVRRTAEICRGLSPAVLVAELDVSDAEAVQRHARDVVDHYGEVDLVFNNAGVGYNGTVREQTREDITRVLDVNLWGVINGTQAFLPHLIASGRGHVVNISSVFGIMAVPSQSAYNASKFAVRGYTESLAAEVAAEKLPVQVSCVHPGGVATRIAQDAMAAPGRDRDEMASQFDQVARTTPMQAARTILAGVERDRTRILVGPDARLLDVLIRVLGGAYPKLIGWVIRRRVDTLQSSSPSEPPAATTRAAPDASSS